MKLEFKIETQLINWNEVASMCYSQQRNKYANAKKRQQLFIKHEVANQIELMDYFGKNLTTVTYEWHTSTNHDLGNLTAGEKFIADSINELGLWEDDRFIKTIRHDRIEDTENYVLVTIKGAKKR